jgi:hypothetical protein
VLENGNTENDIQTGGRYLFENLRKYPFNCCDLWFVLQITGKCGVYKNCPFQIRKNGANESSVVATSEITDSFVVERSRALPDLMRGQPDAESIDNRRTVILPEGTRACSLASVCLTFVEQ